MWVSYTDFGVVRPLWNRQGHCTGYSRCVARYDLLLDVLDFVHPGNFKNHPPSPVEIARKGEQIGLGKMDEFFVWK